MNARCNVSNIIYFSAHLSLYLVAFPFASLRNSQVVCNTTSVPYRNPSTLLGRRTPETWQTKNVPPRLIPASAPSSVPPHHPISRIVNSVLSILPPSLRLRTISH